MKWQELQNQGLNIFKKVSRSRTLWIGGSIGIFTLFAWIILLAGVTSTYTGDINCGEECISYVNITSTYWRICFEDDFKLVQTQPEIPVDVYVPTIKSRADKIVDGNYWRFFDSSKDCIERKNEYNKLPNRFMLVGHKSGLQTVKWSIDKFDIDPAWIGGSTTLNFITVEPAPTYQIDMGLSEVDLRKTGEELKDYYFISDDITMEDYWINKYHNPEYNQLSSRISMNLNNSDRYLTNKIVNLTIAYPSNQTFLGLNIEGNYSIIEKEPEKESEKESEKEPEIILGIKESKSIEITEKIDALTIAELDKDKLKIVQIDDYNLETFQVQFSSDEEYLIQAFVSSEYGINEKLYVYIEGSFAGGSGTAGDPYQISNWSNLNETRDDLTASYILINDINSSISDYGEYDSSSHGGAGWDPIGSSSSQFTGTFDGNSYSIDDLYINRSSESYTGLFGYMNNAVVGNLTMNNCTVYGLSSTACLAGTFRSTTGTNLGISGNVITNTGSGQNVGMIVGQYRSGTLIESYAKGNVTGDYYYTGGMIGLMFQIGSSITDSYSTVNVLGNANVIGGLVGSLSNTGNVTNAYSTGNVVGADNEGGMLGFGADVLVNSSYYDNETSGQTDDDGRGFPRTTAHMMDITTYENWSIIGVSYESTRNTNYVWNIVDGESYPFLSWQPIIGNVKKDVVVTDATLINITAQATFTHLNISDEGLIVYFPFDIENTTTTVYEWTDHQTDATIVDMDWEQTDCIIGACANFTRDLTGVDIKPLNYVNGPEEENLTSISMWVKLHERGEASQGRYMEIESGMSIYPDGGIRFDREFSGTNALFRAANDNQNVNVGTWVHYVITYNASAFGNQAILYINGSSISFPQILVPTGTPDPLDADLTLASNDAGLRDANLTMDEFMIFNRILSPDEVAQIYNNSFKRFKNPGLQELSNQTILGIDSGNDKVNVTTNIQNLSGSSINLSIGYYDGSWSMTDSQVVTSGENISFTISDTSTNLTLNYTLNGGGNETNTFYSPIIEDLITIEIYESGGPPVDNPPTSTLSLPLDNNVTEPTEVLFECNATDDINLQNVTLYVWDSSDSSLIITNSTDWDGTTNTTTLSYNFTEDVNTLWNCLVFDNSTTLQNAWATSNFSLDIVTPSGDECNITDVVLSFWAYDGGKFIDGMNSWSCDNTPINYTFGEEAWSYSNGRFVDGVGSTTTTLDFDLDILGCNMTDIAYSIWCYNETKEINGIQSSTHPFTPINTTYGKYIWEWVNTDKYVNAITG